MIDTKEEAILVHYPRDREVQPIVRAVGVRPKRD